MLAAVSIDAAIFRRYRHFHFCMPCRYALLALMPLLPCYADDSPAPPPYAMLDVTP